MKNKRVILVALLAGLTSLSFAESNLTQEANVTEVTTTVVASESSSSDAMEEQILKALAGVTSLTVLKEGESKIVSESEAMVLDKDKPKVVKKVKRKIRRTTHKKRIKRKKKSANMDNLPMAKTYSMDYDVSLIKE